RARSRGVKQDITTALWDRLATLGYGLPLVALGKLSAEEYVAQLDTFVAQVQTVHPDRNGRNEEFTELDTWRRMMAGHAAYLAAAQNQAAQHQTVQNQALSKAALEGWLGLLEGTVDPLRQVSLVTPPSTAQLFQDLYERAEGRPAIQLEIAKLSFTMLTADRRPEFRPEMAVAAAKALLQVARSLAPPGPDTGSTWQSAMAWLGLGGGDTSADLQWVGDALPALAGLVPPPPDRLDPSVLSVLDLLRSDLAVGGQRPTDRTPADWLSARLDALDSALAMVFTGVIDAAEITRRLDDAERLLTEVP